MNTWNPHLLHLRSEDGDCRGHVPPPDEIAVSNLLEQKGYVRVLNFLDAAVAEGAYRELTEDQRYVRTDRSTAADKPTGYRLGILKSVLQTLSPNVQGCCDLLTGADFLHWLSRLNGHPVQVSKPPTLFRMERGDRIERHDDVSDRPLNCISATLHLSKYWKREFGGNTVLGEVKRIDSVHLGEYLGQRWVFSVKRSVLPPIFNSLNIIALKQGMAHGVTGIKAGAYRVSIVCLYAAEH
jgi:hypothetical protein